jgi:DNA (cytosine-5)-methyltransferase 1
MLVDELGEAKPHIDILIVGPPCQNYSIMNAYSRPHGRANIASVATLVEAYNPSILLIENVVEYMRSRNWPENSQNITSFSRFLAFLASLGYKYQLQVMVSAQHGSSQVRNRFILIAAASNHPLPDFPKPSHLYQTKESPYFDNVNYADICILIFLMTL